MIKEFKDELKKVAIGASCFFVLFLFIALAKEVLFILLLSALFLIISYFVGSIIFDALGVCKK